MQLILYSLAHQNAGSVADVEEEEDDIFNHSGLPGKVSGEIEVVTRSIEQNSNDDEGKDHEEKVVVVMIPQENKRQNKKTKDRKEEKTKWKKSHLKNSVVIAQLFFQKK